MSKLLMIGTGPVAIQLANICYLKSDYEIDMVDVPQHQKIKTLISSV